MKRLLLCLVILTGTLSVMAQKYGSWHSSVTGRDYGVLAENIKGKSFDCFIYGQSLNKHIPIVGMRLSSKHIPAFVKELRSLADKAGLWWDTKAPVTGIEDAAVLFDTNFKNVTAWFDIGTPPEPEYHNMKDAHVEAYTQMMFVGDDAVYLSVAPIVDKDKNRHPGFILPFGSKKEIEALITAIESLNPNVEEAYCIFCDVNLKTGEAHKQNCPYYQDAEANDSLPASQSPQQESVSVPQPMHDICITCPHCGATFVGKSASLFFNEHCKKDCPRFNQIIQVPQVPATPDFNKATKE
ncbi:MAG: hypothetical protein Q4E58_04610 [Prevotellaceae bacterium]|nr:hypothetical protein [Prevotellaceae bacterium]